MTLANEAVLCFRCLESEEAPNGFSQIPVTAEFMDISLQIIYQNRYSAITGIKNFLTTVCSRIFSDIVQQVIPSSYITSHNQPLIIPGFPHPTFGSINVMPSVASLDNFSSRNEFPIPSGIWGWNASCIATENDRTLFLTFSRGFPVSEAEVRLVFTEIYGENCVKGVHIPKYGGNLPNENLNSNQDVQQQSLYARLVLDSVVTVDRILMGESKQKFYIDGKPIWARGFLDLRSCSVPSRRNNCFSSRSTLNLFMSGFGPCGLSYDLIEIYIFTSSVMLQFCVSSRFFSVCAFLVDVL
ncbi:hypothetical protein F2Q70_00043577 [Brassica cretica]|uniref:Uncharacterized protein n=1 Tax=Brassica cretica TaxID=69181 RepID=A0A8S9KFY4_BRACR|nr:hypothetical protein F2Q70_00043577 [Brassica cretica]